MKDKSGKSKTTNARPAAKPAKKSAAPPPPARKEIPPPPPLRPPSPRATALIAAALFLSVFAFLLYGAAPSLYWGDSAEYTTLGCTLGVGHSPGYPLLTMAGRLFAALPIEPFPFRTHHVSMFFGALAAVVFFLFLTRLTGNLFAAGAGAVLFALSEPFVTHNLYAEAYGLHFFLFAAALYFLAEFERDGRPAPLLFALALLFTGLSHHLLMTFVFIGAGVMLLLSRGRGPRITGAALLLLFGAYAYLMFTSYGALEAARIGLKFALPAGAGATCLYAIYLAFDKRGALRDALATAVPALFLLVLGLFFFAWLPLASARDPLLDWWNPETPARLEALLLLKGYSATLPGGWLGLFGRLKAWDIMRHVPPPALIAVVPGLVLLAARRTRLFAALAAILLLNGFAALLIEHGKPEALRIPLVAVAIVFMAAGVAWFLSLRIMRSPGWRRALAVPIVLGAAVLCGVAAERAARLPMNAGDGAWRLGNAIVSDVGDGGVLLAGVQTPSILDYFQACENTALNNKRAAIIPVSFLSFSWKLEQLRARYPWLEFPEFAPDDERDLFRLRSEPRGEYLGELLKRNHAAIRSIHADFLFVPPGLNLAAVPFGFIYALVPERFAESPDAFAALDKPLDWGEIGSLDPVSRLNIASVHNERGDLYMQYAAGLNDEQTMRRAIEEFDLALKIKPDYPEALANKGAALNFLGDYKTAVKLQRRAADLAPAAERAPFFDQLATTHFRKQSRESVTLALGYWQSAAILEPRNARYHHNIGTAMVAVQNLEAAVAEYQRAIELNPRYVEAYVNSARVLLQLGNCGAATSSAERARILAPELSEVRAELIVIYHQCRMVRLYEAELSDYIREFPHDLDFYHNLGVIYRDTDNLEAAVRAWREGRKLNPDYQLATLFESVSDCAQAVPLTEEVAALVPDDPGARILLASRLYLCDRRADSQKTLEAAARDFPGHPGVKKLLEQINERK